MKRNYLLLGVLLVVSSSSTVFGMRLPPGSGEFRNRSPLHHAVRCGDLSAVQEIIHNFIDAGHEGEPTPLHIAAGEGFVKIVEELLRCGAMVDSRDGLRQTPLFWAAAKGHAQVVEILLNAGADACTCDLSDRTASYWASLRGHTEIVQTLEAAMAKRKRLRANSLK